MFQRAGCVLFYLGASIATTTTVKQFFNHAYVLKAVSPVYGYRSTLQKSSLLRLEFTQKLSVTETFLGHFNQNIWQRTPFITCWGGERVGQIKEMKLKVSFPCFHKRCSHGHAGFHVMSLFSSWDFIFTTENVRLPRLGNLCFPASFYWKLILESISAVLTSSFWWLVSLKISHDETLLFDQAWSWWFAERTVTGCRSLHWRHEEWGMA